MKLELKDMKLSKIQIAKSIENIDDALVKAGEFGNNMDTFILKCLI